MPPMPLMHAGFVIEVFYSFIIIVSALLIYFSTRDIYKLSSHKGIKYFRNAFLFFAIAFFFRFVIKFIISLFSVPRFFIHSPAVSAVTLFVFIYASTIAMFYLLYSVMWKKVPKKYENIYALHLVAIFISALSISTQNVLVLLLLQAIIFLFIAAESYRSYRKSRKKGVLNLYAVYMLLFVFWIFNILDILVPDVFRPTQLIIYVISAGLFLLILYKVLRKTGS